MMNELDCLSACTLKAEIFKVRKFFDYHDFQTLSRKYYFPFFSFLFFFRKLRKKAPRIHLTFYAFYHYLFWKMRFNTFWSSNYGANTDNYSNCIISFNWLKWQSLTFVLCSLPCYLLTCWTPKYHLVSRDVVVFLLFFFARVQYLWSLFRNKDRTHDHFFLRF